MPVRTRQVELRRCSSRPISAALPPRDFAPPMSADRSEPNQRGPNRKESAAFLRSAVSLLRSVFAPFSLRFRSVLNVR